MSRSPAHPRWIVILAGGAMLLSTACLMVDTGPGNITPANLSPAERGVTVYHQAKPNCDYEELGTVEARSGTDMVPGTFESSVARLQRRAFARRATGVIILDHGKNGNLDYATGLAIRCR